MARGSVDVRLKSRVHYVSRVIRLHLFFACFYKSLHSHGCAGCHKTLVSRLHLFQTFVGGIAKQVELSIRCVVKATTKVPLKCLLGKHFTHSRREENVGMRSKLPMIGGNSATFKSSLLGLFGLYTKRLLCKFEKDYSVIEMCRWCCF